MPMSRWKYKINIKQFLSDETTQEAKITACNGVISELNKLKRTREFRDDDELEMFIIDLEGIAEDTGADHHDFNYVLDSLYDWADAKRVWMGL